MKTYEEAVITDYFPYHNKPFYKFVCPFSKCNCDYCTTFIDRLAHGDSISLSNENAHKYSSASANPNVDDHT
jgi:hypothetical protein